MGKYMRKSKTTTVDLSVSLLDVSHSLGVRTRAKTLALQKLQTSAATLSSAGGVSYLQLRSRRLEKRPIGDSKRQRHSSRQRCVPNPSPNPNPNPNPNSRERSRLRVGSANSDEVVEGGNLGKKVAEDLKQEEVQQEINNNGVDLGIEASFGENVLDFEGTERTTRESTPCSLIRDPEAIRTPGSSTRPTRAVRNSTPRHIPTAHEMNEFFTGAEDRQKRKFIEKYNFDPVKDKPLPGRYKWVKMNP